MKSLSELIPLFKSINGNSDYAIINKTTIENISVNQFLQRTSLWIKKEKAIQNESNYESSIYLIHRGNYGDSRYIKKEFLIEYYPSGSNVIVIVKIKKIDRKADGIYLSWMEIIEDYYKTLGLDITKEVLLDLYGKEGITKMSNSLLFQLLIVTLFLLFGVIVTIWRFNLFIPLFLSILFIFLFIPILKNYKEFRVKKRIITK